MAGMFYDQRPRSTERSVLDAFNDAHSARAVDLEKKLEQEINSFNALAKKHNHVMFLRYYNDVGRGVKCLQLGTKEQFEYDVCQATLTSGAENSLLVATSLRIQHCAEWGE